MSSGAQPTTPDIAAPRWGRSLAIYGAALAVLIGLGAAWIATRPTPSYEKGPGSLVMSATDFAFSPSSATWRVGERVRLTIDNDSEANPGKVHEFMMGRRPVMGETAFGSRPTGGFQTGFFEGVGVHIMQGKGLTMAQPGGAKMSQREIDRFVTAPGPGLGGMEMGGMEMGGMHGMEGMQMGGETADLSGENGFMLMLDPGGSVTLSFVVPDKPGRWQFGCFQQTGQHYTNGMRGQVNVEGS